MKIPFKNRKKIHIVLFACILTVQIIIIYLWSHQNNEQKNFTAALENSSKTNTALVLVNEATKYYFDAENHINLYFQDYNNKELIQYNVSIEKMTTYLDSLKTISETDTDFKMPISIKKKIEIDVVVLRKQLDSIMKSNLTSLSLTDEELSKLKPYNSSKLIGSIHFDTLKNSEDVVKKGLLGRIGDAISGKYEVKKEEVQIYVSMLYGNKTQVDRLDKQLAKMFETTDKYYIKEFEVLKKTYKNLREKDKLLLKINQEILNKSQEILSFFTNKNINNSIKKYAAIDTKSSNQRDLIFTLLSIMMILTLLLLGYTIYAFIYEKNLAEAKIEADKNLDFKNRIIGMLSHEMRAPLNIISNFSNKIKKLNKDKEIDEIATSLHFTSNSLQITVNQILNFFKTENTKLVLYKTNVNLKEEIKSITKSLQTLADAKKIKLIEISENNLNVIALADVGKIHQVFFNIIGNAIKFTDKGSVTIKSHATEIGNKIKLEVSIKDTGVGIPQADVEHIFDKYYQSTNSASKVSLGAGLGLNLCKEIVELHDGEITVNSIIDKGTEISFYLMLEKMDSSKDTNKNKLLKHSAQKSIKVAVVDDDLLITTILKKLCKEINFSCVTFHSANEIKNYLNENDVDLILSDIEISGYSGLQLVKEIKNLKNSNSKIPIIAITGDNYMATIDLKTIDVDEIIIKPIDKEELYFKFISLLMK